MIRYRLALRCAAAADLRARASGAHGGDCLFGLRLLRRQKVFTHLEVAWAIYCLARLGPRRARVRRLQPRSRRTEKLRFDIWLALVADVPADVVDAFLARSTNLHPAAYTLDADELKAQWKAEFSAGVHVCVARAPSATCFCTICIFALRTLVPSHTCIRLCGLLSARQLRLSAMREAPSHLPSPSAVR